MQDTASGNAREARRDTPRAIFRPPYFGNALQQGEERSEQSKETKKKFFLLQGNSK
jgi:hypothetical protein